MGGLSDKGAEKHWPDVPRWRDIRALTERVSAKRQECERLTLFWGFPNQPHSVIGKRLAEKRRAASVARVHPSCQELRPKYVVGENVNGILSTIHESVCSDLEKEGYEV